MLASAKRCATESLSGFSQAAFVDGTCILDPNAHAFVASLIISLRQMCFASAGCLRFTRLAVGSSAARPYVSSESELSNSVCAPEWGQPSMLLLRKCLRLRTIVALARAGLLFSFPRGAIAFERHRPKSTRFFFAT